MIYKFYKDFEKLRKSKNVNILYLTTKCNLNCEYCFEKNNKIEKDITKKEIDDFIYEICWREKDINSNIVFFGGEPTLKLDLIEYTINKCLKLKNTFWSFKMTTNGILLLENKEIYNKILSLCKNNNFNFLLEISCDGVTSQFRNDKNGNNVSQKILNLLNLLSNEKIKFNISYVPELNYQKIKKDLIFFLTKFQNINHINLSWNNNLFKSLNDKQRFKNDLKEFIKLIYFKYKIPICDDLVCEYCKQCDKIEKKHLFLSPTKKIQQKEILTKKEFENF